MIAKAKPSKTDERAAIEKFLAEKGARKFGAGDSAEPWVLLEYMKKRGVPIEGAPKHQFRYRNKLIDYARLVQMVNAERAKEQKPPLNVGRVA